MEEYYSLTMREDARISDSTICSPSFRLRLSLATTSLQIREYNSTQEETCQGHLESDQTLGAEVHGHQHFGSTAQSILWVTTEPRVVSPTHFKGGKKSEKKRGGTNRFKRNLKYITKCNVSSSSGYYKTIYLTIQKNLLINKSFKM